MNGFASVAEVRLKFIANDFHDIFGIVLVLTINGIKLEIVWFVGLFSSGEMVSVLHSRSRGLGSSLTSVVVLLNMFLGRARYSYSDLH